MTPEQFKKLLKKKQKEINQAFSRTLPVKVGTEAVKFVRENFREEGFVDSKLENHGHGLENGAVIGGVFFHGVCLLFYLRLWVTYI